MMDKFNLVYDHYKETVGFIKENEKKRNSLFIYIIILMVILLLMIFETKITYAVFLKLVENKFGLSIKYSYNVIQMLFWILLLFVLIRYYQINIYIERQYIYLYKCENSLKQVDAKIFCRESEEYNNNYPKILSTMYYFYKFIFSSLIMIIVIYKLYREVIINSNLFFILLDMLIGIIIIILNLQYLIFNYNNGKKYQDKSSKENV